MGARDRLRSHVGVGFVRCCGERARRRDHASAPRPRSSGPRDTGAGPARPRRLAPASRSPGSRAVLEPPRGRVVAGRPTRVRPPARRDRHRLRDPRSTAPHLGIALSRFTAGPRRTTRRERVRGRRPGLLMVTQDDSVARRGARPAHAARCPGRTDGRPARRRGQRTAASRDRGHPPRRVRRRDRAASRTSPRRPSPPSPTRVSRIRRLARRRTGGGRATGDVRRRELPLVDRHGRTLRAAGAWGDSSRPRRSSMPLAAGSEWIHLGVFAENRAALRLYEGLGFRPTGLAGPDMVLSGERRRPRPMTLVETAVRTAARAARTASDSCDRLGDGRRRAGCARVRRGHPGRRNPTCSSAPTVDRRRRTVCARDPRAIDRGPAGGDPRSSRRRPGTCAWFDR